MDKNPSVRVAHESLKWRNEGDHRAYEIHAIANEGRHGTIAGWKHGSRFVQCVAMTMTENGASSGQIALIPFFFQPFRKRSDNEHCPSQSSLLGGFTFFAIIVWDRYDF
jgi:hypothetical protein